MVYRHGYRREKGCMQKQIEIERPGSSREKAESASPPPPSSPVLVPEEKYKASKAQRRSGSAAMPAHVPEWNEIKNLSLFSCF